jgi:uncharacterized protein YdiU (UPF0061 family)
MSDSKKKSSAQEWVIWLELYSSRITAEMKGEDIDTETWLNVRQEEMKAANPRFVLRQWVLEDVIGKCEQNDLQRSREVLGKILEVSSIFGYSLINFHCSLVDIGRNNV